MTNFECFVVITFCYLAFWITRVTYFSVKCRRCIDSLVLIYCVMDVKSCARETVGELINYNLNTEEENVLPVKLYTSFAKLFHTYLQEKIIVDRGENKFIPSFNKNELLEQLDWMVDEAETILKFYDKLCPDERWFLKKKYSSLKTFYGLFYEKTKLVKQMPGNVISFFPKM